MNDFTQILLDNKKSKGQQIDAVIAAVAQIETLDPIYEHSGKKSAIGLSIALSCNEKQAKDVVIALLEKGETVDDAHLAQKHDRSINEALKKSYYDLAFFLISKGAHLNDIVHAYLRRPKSIQQAKGQLQMEQCIWRHSDDTFKQEEHIAVMASLIACEILTGQSTDPLVRKEVIDAAVKNHDEGFNNHHYILSNIDDAGRVLKNPRKAEHRMIQSVSTWHEGIGEGLDKKAEVSPVFLHIPEAFWKQLPGLQSELQAKEMQASTTPISHERRGPRI